MTMKENETILKESRQILEFLELPRKQQNDRTARVLLALLSLSPGQNWSSAKNPKLTIRGIADFIRENLDYDYAENSRESIRKYSVKQLVEASILLHNPDNPKRAVNSSKNCYKVSDVALELLRKYKTEEWRSELQKFKKIQPTLLARYAKIREMSKVPINLGSYEISLSPGDHSELIKNIIEDFGSIFVPGGELVYVGDTGEKWGYFNEEILTELGVDAGNHGKMPDVILYDRKRNWLILVEATASTGPMDGIRYDELTNLFSGSSAGLVFVTAFPDRGSVFRDFLSEVAWETEVWCASDPTHMIHFNGDKFLGPYCEYKK